MRNITIFSYKQIMSIYEHFINFMNKGMNKKEIRAGSKTDK